MKKSDERQINKARENFLNAMSDYFAALDDIADIFPNADEYNTLANQVNKLTKTVMRIRDSH